MVLNIYMPSKILQSVSTLLLLFFVTNHLCQEKSALWDCICSHSVMLIHKPQYSFFFFSHKHSDVQCNHHIQLIALTTATYCKGNQYFITALRQAGSPTSVSTSCRVRQRTSGVTGSMVRTITQTHIDNSWYDADVMLACVKMEV